MGRGGSIQAAINLEMNSAKLSSIDLKIEGLNGQQPNLDLFNLAVRMCRFVNFVCVAHGLRNAFQ